MQEQIVDLLLKEEDVTWKSILYELVKTEQMNPWDINITLLTQKYIEVIKQLQEHNLRVSGKILLAAAFLLKIKSAHLVEHDISQLDRLIHQTEDLDEGIEEVETAFHGKKNSEKYQLIPRNPQPRNRKVSIHDLVEALQRAMATKKRILAQQRPVKFIVPHRKIDIMEVINDIYQKIVYYVEKKDKKELTFSDLLPARAGKQEKVYTFIPLLHLENHHKIATHQKQAFDEIFIHLIKEKKKADVT